MHQSSLRHMSFEIPGGLHIVHNAAKDLSAYMPYFQTSFDNAGSLSIFSNIDGLANGTYFQT